MRGGAGTFTRFALGGDYYLPKPAVTCDPALDTFYLVGSLYGPAQYGVAGTTNITRLKIFTISGAFGAEMFTEAASVTAPYAWDAEPPGGFTSDAGNLAFHPQLGSARPNQRVRSPLNDADR